MEDVKPESPVKGEKRAVEGDLDKRDKAASRYTPVMISASAYSNTSKSITLEKPRYQSNLGLSNIHKITPQYNKYKSEVTHETGETPSKNMSFYEKIVRGEHRNKSDSKDFVSFISGCRDQMAIAKKIMPHASRYYLEKSVRLKRDFKSRNILI